MPTIEPLARWLYRKLKPTERQTIPVPWYVRLGHRLMHAVGGENPLKNKVDSAASPDLYFYDVLMAEEFIRQGDIVTTTATVKTGPYELMWGLTVQGGVVEQDELSNLDLIWVLTMPPERAAVPPKMFTDDMGQLRLLDGSHRIARAIVDGKSAIPFDIISPADSIKFRRPK